MSEMMPFFFSLGNLCSTDLKANEFFSLLLKISEVILLKNEMSDTLRH